MTSIKSPYGPTDPEDKTRVQCNLPTNLYQNLFLERFPMRGAQDRITASLLIWFHNEMSRNEVCLTFDLDNERYAQEFLDQLKFTNIQLTHESTRTV